MVLQNESQKQASRATYHKELKIYLEMLLPAGNIDPVKFWLDNKSKFPNLCKIALRSLMLPASSAASERIVSCLNLILEPKRSRLTERNTNNLVFLHGLDITVWRKFLV